MADRFGWIGASRADRVRIHVHTAVEAWLVDWRVGGSSVLVSRSSPSAHLTWYASPSADVALGLYADVDEVGAWLIGDPAARAGALPAHVGKLALDDLASRFSGHRESLVQDADQPTTPRLAESSVGALEWRIDLEGFVVVARLSRAVSDRIAPTQGHDHADIVPVRQAALLARTTIRAELDLGRMALSELQGLKPGDVLVTDASLETPARLYAGTDNREPFASARLGERHGRRALRLVDR